MPYSISISIANQTLNLLQNQTLIKTYSISSAKNGIGCEEGSYCTPLGNFYIDEKHGYEAPLNTIFKGRQPQGVWAPEQGNSNPEDLVLTRILWLQGLDKENSNTKNRYIYIHGTNHEELIGTPHSCGCIRMKNKEVIELYDSIGIGTKVQVNL